MVVKYTVYDQDGSLVTGSMQAASASVATQELIGQGYRIIEVKEGIVHLNWDFLRDRLSKIRPQEIILFYRQLAVLIRSGIDLVTSLELLLSQTTNHALEKPLGNVISDVRGGSQLSEAMGKFPKVFSKLSCRTLMVGERTGNLEEMLDHIARHYEREFETSKGVKNALLYPIITLCVAVIVIGVLITTVIPAFGTLYAQVGADLPSMTKNLINLGEWMKQNWLLLVSIVLASILFAIAYARTENGCYQWHRLQLNLPYLGRIIQLTELSRISRNLALLYRSGLPMTETLPLVIQNVNNVVISSALAQVNDAMVRGEGISQPMAQYPVFLPLLVQMVRVGEESGTLENTLTVVDQNYDAEAKDRTRSLIGMIQPTMTIFLAIVVGLIALSMVEAMYSIYGQF